MQLNQKFILHKHLTADAEYSILKVEGNLSIRYRQFFEPHKKAVIINSAKKQL